MAPLHYIESMHINQCPHYGASLMSASNLRIFHENSQENSQKKLHTHINIILLTPKSPPPSPHYPTRKLPLKKQQRLQKPNLKPHHYIKTKDAVINPYSPHYTQTTHHCSRHTPVGRLHCQHANAHCNANLQHLHTEFPSPCHLFHQIPSHRN